MKCTSSVLERQTFEIVGIFFFLWDNHLMKTRAELLSLSACASRRPDTNNLITWVKHYNQICIFF